MTEEWSPPFAAHVKGEYEQRRFDPSTGLPKPQTVTVRCEKCGMKWATICGTGQVRAHIVRFATLHLHAAPAEPKG